MTSELEEGATGRPGERAEAAPAPDDGPSATDVAPVAPAHPQPRPATFWDLAGLLLAAATAFAVTAVLIKATGVGLGSPVALLTSLLLCAGGLGLLLIRRIWRDRPRPREIVERLVRTWRDPAGSWTAFVTGWILTIPLWGLWAPVLFADADSARIVAGVTHVQHFGIGFLLDTQDNLLPHLLLGPVISLFGVAGAKAFTIFTLQVAVGVAAYIAHRTTGRMSAVVVAALVMVALPPTSSRAAFVPMYPAMLALGYLGCWLVYRSITADRSSWRWWGLGGLCLAMTPEAQPVGVVFLPVPILLTIFARDRRSALRTLALVYGTIAVVSIPRLLINLSVGGFSHLASYRTDYWNSNGYIREIQVDYWGYPGVSESTGAYVSALPGRVLEMMTPFGGVCLAVAALGWVFGCSPRARGFVLLAAMMFTGLIVYKQIPPFDRYFSPIMPGIAILAGSAVGALMARRAIVARLTGAIAVAALAVVTVLTLTAQMIRLDAVRNQVESDPFRALAAIADDGKGVIGARSHGLVNVTSDIPTWGGQFLTEQEYVTYLTWPSDQAVIDMMRSHDIGWVLITKKRGLETDYHDTWLVPHYGLHARQVDSVAASPEFCLRFAESDYLLYQLGPC